MWITVGGMKEEYGVAIAKVEYPDIGHFEFSDN
jgi:hypothetical protein